MPKQLYEIKDFSGGLNCYADPRDIKDEEFAQNWNVIVDKNGILRIVGSAVNHINATHIVNDNFQTGSGLFQFTADYAINANIDGTFNLGYEQGTVVSASSGTVFVIEDTPTRTDIDNYYNGMTIFIYQGVNAGETRLISDYAGTTGTAGTVTVAPAFTATPTTTSKYMIFRWTSSDWETSDANKDFITNGLSERLVGYDSGFPSANGIHDNYYLCTKDTAEDETSVDLGYLEFITSGVSSGTYLTLTPSQRYNFSFDMAFKDRWYNLVADGAETGAGTMYGDKVPWVQLYSETVENDSGALRSLDEATITSGTATTITGSWEGDKTHTNISQKSSTGNGSEVTFNITTDADGSDVTFKIIHGGKNYVVDEEITVVDPGSTSYEATVKVEAVNNKGLSLYADGWMSQNTNQDATGDNATYLSKVDSNYIDNGDFDHASNGWSDVGNIHTGQVTGGGAGAYGGTDGSLVSRYLSTTGGGITFTDNIPDSYFKSDNLTLDVNTRYHLNFNYVAQAVHGTTLTYAVYNETSGNYLISWTPLDYTIQDVGATGHRLNPHGPWRFVNQRTDEEGRRGQKYVNFYVHSSSTSITESVSIRFSLTANISAYSRVRVSGVTVYKAHHDLSTMAYRNKQSLNPFFNSLTWSNYSLNFTVPSSYSTVSDWKLRIYGGKWGWRDGNLIEDANAEEATDTQEVYIDNIRLSSDSSETHTLLSQNTNEKSKVALYNSNIWDGNFVVWEGPNANPTFNYVNGILKISDSNFKTGNANMLAYYDNTISDSGWRVRDEELSTPPSLTLSNVEGSTVFEYEYDAIPDLNELYYQMRFNNDAGSPFNGTYGWRMDNFGTTDQGAYNNNGIICRYFSDNQHQLANEGHQYKISDRINESGGLHLPTSIGSDYQVATGGFSFPGTAESLLSIGENSNHHTNCWIQGSKIRDFLDVLGHEGSFSIHSIEFDITWRRNMERVGGGGNQRHPYWSFEAGVQSNTGMNPNVEENVQQMIDDNNDTGASSIWSHDGLDNSEDTYTSLGPLLVDYDRWSTIDYNAPGTSYENGDGEARIHNHSMTSVLEGWGPDEWTDEEETIPYTNYVPVDNFTNLIFKFSEPLEGMTDDAAGHYYGDYYLWTDDAPYIRAQCQKWHYGANNDDAWTGTYPDIRAAGHYNYASYSKFDVHKINVRFWNPNWQHAYVDPTGGNEAQLNITWGTSSNFEGSGWGARIFDIGVSSVNYFGEESGIYEDNTLDTSGYPGAAEEDESPDITIILGQKCLLDNYVKETKFYMKERGTDIWYLQFYVKNEDKLAYSSTSGKGVGGVFLEKNYIYDIPRSYLKNFNEVDSYESLTSIQKNDISKIENLTCRYKTSVVCNNRLYVGNIYQNGRVYGDRMLKSPINKYNILPASNFIDVAINDGDEITALAYYKDKILQFKKKKVFIINVSGDYEFLEDTFNDIGVDGQFSVTTTQYGIAWANEDGCFLYDGEKLNDLTAGKIPISSSYANPANSVSQQNRWCANASTGDCIAGYSRNKQTLLINFTRADTDGAIPSGATYHFPTKSWALLYSVWADNTNLTNSGNMSNMVTNDDGDIMFYSKSSEANLANTIRKWVHESSSTLATKNAYFITKDITFGNINVKKKIYKVYITYRVDARTDDDTDTGVVVVGAINGTGTFNVAFSTSSKFMGTSTDCYAGTTLDATGADWKTAELKFATPSQVNNITSFQLELYGAIAYDFEVNDISISYRVKNIK